MCASIFRSPVFLELNLRLTLLAVSLLRRCSFCIHASDMSSNNNVGLDARVRESSYARCYSRERERESIYSASAVMQRAAHYVCVLIKERPGCDASLLLSENNNTRGAIRFLSLALTTVVHTQSATATF